MTAAGSRSACSASTPNPTTAPTWQRSRATARRSVSSCETIYPPLLDATPQWTPDDSQIVFDLDGRLATIGADGSGFKDLDAWATSDYARRSFSLSPDGRLIAYTTSLRDTEGRHDIWIIQTNGENPRPLLQSASAPVWQP